MTTREKRPTYIDHAEQMLTEMRSLKSGLDRKLYMMERWPHFPDRFWDNHMGTLVRMDAIQLIEALGQPDPTGERAVRNVMQEAA